MDSIQCLLKCFVYNPTQPPISRTAMRMNEWLLIAKILCYLLSHFEDNKCVWHLCLHIKVLIISIQV